MLGDLGQQLGQAIVVDLHLEFFVDGVEHLAIDAIGPRIRNIGHGLRPDLVWLRPVTFDAHDDCVTFVIIRRETRDRGTGPAVSLTSECGFRAQGESVVSSLLPSLFLHVGEEQITRATRNPTPPTSTWAKTVGSSSLNRMPGRALATIDASVALRTLADR